MGKLFRYLRQAGPSVLVIVALLVVQAFCDLSLPTYTSDIVDVGIQQGGIDHVSPEIMGGDTWRTLALLLSDPAPLEGAYAPDGEGRYVRTARDDDLAALDQALTTPLAALAALRAQGLGPEEIQAGLAGGSLTEETLAQAYRQALQALAGEQEATLEQRALAFTRGEYQDLGMDLHRIQMDYLLSTGGKMLGVSLLMAACAIAIGLLAARAAARVGMVLREQVFRKVVSFSSAEMDAFSTASLITRSTNDIQQIQMVAVLLLRIVFYAPIVGIGGIFMVRQTRTGMGWIIGVAVGAVMLVVALLMGLAMPRFRRMQTLVDRLNLVSREILTGLSVIRAFSREDYEAERFEGANTDLMRTQLFTSRCMNFMMPAMMLVMNGVSVLIVWTGAHGVDMGRMQVGDMIAFITYTMIIIMAFLMISIIAVFLPRASVAAGRIDQVLSTRPAISDAPQTLDGQLDHCRGVVAFEDVSFRYPGAGDDVLSHISFTARPGQTTAVIGSTGSGKSTLINLIPRFFDVTGGRITLDGVDIRQVSQHRLRELMGYVPQKGVLFSGDIASNLKFGGADITDGDMEEAAAIAQAADFIQAKPEGYHAPIAQGGSNVSGGAEAAAVHRPGHRQAPQGAPL